MERRRQRWGGRGSSPPYRCNFHETPLSLSYKFEKEKEEEEGLEKEERETAPPAMILAPPPPVGGSVCISRGGVREPVVVSLRVDFSREPEGTAGRRVPQ